VRAYAVHMLAQVIAIHMLAQVIAVPLSCPCSTSGERVRQAPPK